MVSEKSNILISVILPIYKVEKYLQRCVESIINQTYTNLEIILVDDGSPDGCPAICDDYATKDQRVKVVHKKNGGLSEARNAGTMCANGEYIAYVDPDDVVSSDYIEYLYRLTENGQYDISGCDFFRGSASSPVFENQDEDSIIVLDGKDACGRIFSDAYLRTVVAWGKLIRTVIAKKYLFPVGRLHEDEATTYKYYFEAENVAFGSKKKYCYFVNENGIMGTEEKQISEDFLWASENRIAFFEAHHRIDLVKADVNRLFKYLTVRYKSDEEFNKYIKRYQRKYFNRTYISIKNIIKYMIMWRFKVIRDLYIAIV